MIRRIWITFRQWLLSDTPARPQHLGNPDLHPIDTEQLAKELKVVEDAETLGRKDLPATGSSGLTGPEAKIVQVIEKARQDYLDWGADRLKVLNQQIKAADIASMLARVRDLVDEFERKASERIDRWAAELAALAKSVEHREQDYAAFVRENQISRPPNCPTNSAKLLRRAWLGAFVLVEGAANSVFFAQGVWGGLVEGFFYAAMFAATNVLIGYVSGRYVWPERNHVAPLRKAIGWIGVPVTVAAIVLMAFVIGHFRDAATSGNMANGAQVALAQLKDAPFALKDIYSWLLAGISVAFAAGALLASYGLDDPYPGYGNVYRDLVEAKTDWESQLQGVRDELSEMKDEALEQLDSLLERMKTELRKLDESIGNKQGVEQRLITAFAHVDLCLEALILKFRTANELNRNTERPEYFAIMPKPKALTLPDFNTTADRRKYNEQEKAFREIQDHATEIRASIQASFSKQFDRLVPIEQQIKSEAA